MHFDGAVAQVGRGPLTHLQEAGELTPCLLAGAGVAPTTWTGHRRRLAACRRSVARKKAMGIS